MSEKQIIPDQIRWIINNLSFFELYIPNIASLNRL